MARGRFGIVISLAALVAMTGIFTALSADRDRSEFERSDAIIAVNGELIPHEQFTNRLATAEQNMLDLETFIEMSPGSVTFHDEVLNLMQATPMETIALASLILDVSTAQEAMARGYTIDEEELRAMVTREQLAFEIIEEDPEEYGQSVEGVEAYRAFIDSIGEDHYWSDYFPAVLEQRIAVEQLRAEVIEAGDDWNSVQREVLMAADVEVLDEGFLEPATVDGAREYMLEAWRIVES